MISEMTFENLYTQVNRVEKDNAVMKTEFTSRFEKIDTVFTARFDAMDKQFSSLKWFIGILVGIIIAFMAGFASIVIPMINNKEKQQTQSQIPAINNYYQIPQGHEIKPKK